MHADEANNSLLLFISCFASSPSASAASSASSAVPWARSSSLGVDGGGGGGGLADPRELEQLCLHRHPRHPHHVRFQLLHRPPGLQRKQGVEALPGHPNTGPALSHHTNTHHTNTSAHHHTPTHHIHHTNTSHRSHETTMGGGRGQGARLSVTRLRMFENA